MPELQNLPDLTAEIHRASAIELTDVSSQDTVLRTDELLAFVAILTTFLKSTASPFGSYALYAWPNNQPEPECVLFFNFAKGRYEFKRYYDETPCTDFNSQYIVNSSVRLAVSDPRHYSNGSTSEAKLTSEDGRIKTGLYHKSLCRSVAVAKATHGRFLCSHFGQYAANARHHQYHSMLATMRILLYLRPKDYGLADAYAKLEYLINASMHHHGRFVDNALHRLIVGQPPTNITRRMKDLSHHSVPTTYFTY